MVFGRHIDITDGQDEMNVIEFEASVSSEMSEKVFAELQSIEEREGVHILFAIESGSRAWGFPSPDSDYDARFVYVRPRDWYLSISPGRDVIELPIDDLLDINGWDIRKALGLLTKPNPVLLEWLSSPIRYMWNDDVCQHLINLSNKIAHGRACIHHYLHLGERQWQVYIEGKDRIKLKKYFYAVRPAMALRWIRLQPDKAPPMNFQELMKGAGLDDALSTAIGKLLIAKSQAKEIGEAERIPVIDDFLKAEFDWARTTQNKHNTKSHDLKKEADELFRSIVNGECN